VTDEKHPTARLEYPGGSAEFPLVGAVDGDGDVDLNDINLINAARNQPASGPTDPRDLNRDGRIDALDARIAVTKCTRSRCAVT
jgi:hypothetical protein